MKVALVYDRVNKFGGAERILVALHEIWPKAPLYTAVYDPQGAPWAREFEVRPSFIQQLPLAKHHEFYPWLTPLAFESFSFDEFNLVISVTSAEAKNIITKPGTLHVCYCLTPTRYLWSGYQAYQHYPGLGRMSRVSAKLLRWAAPTLQRWDKIAATRPDAYVAISHAVKERIARYYERKVAAVIYPPVDTKKFQIPNSKFKISQDGFFLVVARLVGYKRVDIVIDAFNRLGWPLVVIGDGWEWRKLKNQARSNIRFIRQHLTDGELVGYYQNCRAIVFAGEEDFGLVAVEAQACGKPVIAFRESGMAEAIEEGKTGLLFKQQTSADLVGALHRFNQVRFDSNICRNQAMQFDTRLFQEQMKATIDRLYRNRTHV